MVPTFALNSGPAVCQLEAPFTIGMFTGPNGSLLSSCTTCPGTDPDQWCNLGDAPGQGIGFVVDQILSVGTGSSGAAVWDMTGYGTIFCPEIKRAYGSGSFANSNHLTTALGVDQMGWPWVFKGLGPPPPATVEQQIKEIVRLLLTPEGLRCSGLDRHPGNGLIEDDPIVYPDGGYVDPISPQVTSYGELTGDEMIDDLRNSGWLP